MSSEKRARHTRLGGLRPRCRRHRAKSRTAPSRYPAGSRTESRNSSAARSDRCGGRARRAVGQRGHLQQGLPRQRRIGVVEQHGARWSQAARRAGSTALATGCAAGSAPRNGGGGVSRCARHVLAAPVRQDDGGRRDCRPRAGFPAALPAPGSATVAAVTEPASAPSSASDNRLCGLPAAPPGGKAHLRLHALPSVVRVQREPRRQRRRSAGDRGVFCRACRRDRCCGR